jgi:purine-nucleoside phosphorylase
MNSCEKESFNFIKTNLKFSGNTAIILGSGLGHLSDILESKKIIKYQNIPNYPKTTIDGHVGELVFGRIQDKEILIANGRFHLYEGYSIQQINYPFRIFKELGIENIIITNSSGSCNKDFHPGTIMMIDKHIDFSFQEDFKKPRIRKGNEIYSKYLLKIAAVAAKSARIEFVKGTYCWVLGPMYETPEEINYFRSLGGSAVGMSGVPEVEICNKLGFSVLMISNLTNYAAGISDKKLTHEDVISNAAKNKKKLTNFLLSLIKRL